MLLVSTWFGSFLLDGASVRAKRLFPKDALEISKRLAAMDRGDVLPEEMELLKECDYSADVCERRLSQFGKVSDERPQIAPAEHGFAHSLLHDAMMLLGAAKSREAPGEDFHIIQALRAIDSLAESVNMVSERVRDWYSVHFPELGRLVQDEKYVSLVASGAGRDEIAQKVGFGAQSIGSPVGDAEIVQVRAAARTAASLSALRQDLEKYITVKMRETAPNLSLVAGPIVGARLIAIAGGLEKLAQKPSSTVQLLGAETALFRHLKSGALPPKYGVIFQHPLIHSAPRHSRGKVARALAGAISIAAKVDSNRGAFIGDRLKERLEKRLQAIAREKPKARPPPMAGRRRGQGPAPARSRAGFGNKRQGKR